MIEDMIERENRIFETLQKFREEGLEFILVGGYGISAFSHRFSVDADIVVRESDLDRFTDILKENGFEEAKRKDLESVYGGRFISYKKDRDMPVTLDLLVNSLDCRQTGGSWSYQYLKKNSSTRTVEGSEKSVRAEVPDKELLMSIKLHSARTTDIRDVVALGEGSDFYEVKIHIERGDKAKIKDSLDKVLKELNSDEFKDSFKGVFQESEIPEGSLESLRDFLKDLKETWD